MHFRRSPFFLERDAAGVTGCGRDLWVRPAVPGDAADDPRWRRPGTRTSTLLQALPQRGARAAADAAALATALFVATLLRHDGHIAEVDLHGLLLLTPVATSGTRGRHRFGLYTGRWAYGSFEEMPALARPRR